MNYVLSEHDVTILKEMAAQWRSGEFQRHFYRRRNMPTYSIGGGKVSIFEVQSAAAGDGVYNCYQQKLLDAEWADTAGDDRFAEKDAEPEEVEVLNLLENHVEGSYTRGLARYDRLQCWRWTDNEGTSRWVGVPLTPHCRRFKCTESATGNDHITCNAILNDGSEAGEGDILFGIEVYCEIHNDTALNEAVPRLVSGKYLEAQHIRGKWICTTVFQGNEECQCVPPE